MEFKAGDRVHVTRLDGGKVNFYATLSEFDSYNEAADLVNCTDSSFEGAGVYLPNKTDFGPDKIDYYTLATDEEYNDLNIAKNMKEGCTMPTIKTKKEMNLPELIEWAIKKDIKDEKFYSKNGCHISIDYRGHVFLWDIRLNEIFTVEVEEEITEDTEIKELVELGNYGHGKEFFWHYNTSINEELDIGSESFYIMNDDLTMTLIWEKGKMVE